MERSIRNVGNKSTWDGLKFFMLELRFRSEWWEMMVIVRVGFVFIYCGVSLVVRFRYLINILKY